MSSWIDQKARRLLIAGALAFAVGAPTIACMGGETSGDEAGGDDGGDDGGGDEAKKASEKLLGSWQVQPSKEDFRLLKIINMALNPKMNLAKFKEKMKPPPNQAEIAQFEEFKKLPPDSPEAQFLKMQIKMMKESNLEITDSKWILDVAGEKDEWTYTIDSETDDSVTVKLSSGETNTLKFLNDNKLQVKIKDAGGEMELMFARK